MITAKSSDKRTIKFIVGDAEFSITAKLSQIEAIKELLIMLKASCIYDYNYTLTQQQYKEFCNKSVNILCC